MSIFIQILLNSLEIGGIYALASLGIILIFRTSITTNYAQGAISMFNAFVATYILLSTDIPVYVAALLGMLSAFIVGVIVDRVVISRTQNIDPVSKQIITLGLLMVFLGLAPMIFGTDPIQFPRFIYGSHIIFGATISYNAILNIGVVIGIMLFLFYMLQKSKWGLSIRATASNEIVARMMGIPTSFVTMTSWAIAAALGVLSALMLAPTTSVSITMMDGVQIVAFLSCVLGGFQTFYGPVIAAYIIGFASNFISYYISSIWSDPILYILILVVILFKPNGIFGKKVVKKV
ncbi:branched-chain amino acid ABC transporter permease [Clostridium sp. Cult1]|uniref:branched-chain amino acid ABC transporter permease n=1 Tax=Clostridium sp. Cult1 TaxID=2079002 RepID=UPI001F4257B7|nr:branched-chain amino acid ABC transporter permease [Clostridium sp. Cult1]MCF6463532.1 branched-chain amino acid ABC transporter permease [Clostridium sp. Cult1]